MQCDAVWIYQLVSLPERIDRLQTYIRSCYSAQPTLCSSPFCAIEYLTLVWTINIQSASNFLGNDTNNISRTIEAWRSDIQRRPCNCWISKLNFSWPPHSLLILMSEGRWQEMAIVRRRLPLEFEAIYSSPVASKVVLPHQILVQVEVSRRTSLTVAEERHSK